LKTTVGASHQSFDVADKKEEEEEEDNSKTCHMQSLREKNCQSALP